MKKKIVEKTRPYHEDYYEDKDYVFTSLEDLLRASYYGQFCKMPEAYPEAQASVKNPHGKPGSRPSHTKSKGGKHGRH